MAAQVSLPCCSCPPHLDDWSVWQAGVRSQIGSEEWEVMVLTHQKSQSSVKVQGSPVPRDSPASELGRGETRLSTGAPSLRLTPIRRRLLLADLSSCPLVPLGPHLYPPSSTLTQGLRYFCRVVISMSFLALGDPWKRDPPSRYKKGSPEHTVVSRKVDARGLTSSVPCPRGPAPAASVAPASMQAL